MTESRTLIKNLVDTFRNNQAIQAIGLSGGDRPLPQPGKGDLDFFIYCNEIPIPQNRFKMLSTLEGTIEKINVNHLNDIHWGQGDYCTFSGIDTWLLFFTTTSAQTELDNVLSGLYLDRIDNDYYPIARCAMWKTMQILYDPLQIITNFKKRLEFYPPELAKLIVTHHFEALDDTEDLERAILRKDIFFYHYAFDIALDHFLQAIFALNLTFFPGRKRSEEIIRNFKIKPSNCIQRIQQVIALGSQGCTLALSFQEWQNLVKELKFLAISNEYRF
jgi:hypothetical protein